MTEQCSSCCSHCPTFERRLSELQRESAVAHSLLLAAFIECSIEHGLHSRVDVIRRLREEQSKLARNSDRLAFEMIGDVARRLMLAY